MILSKGSALGGLNRNYVCFGKALWFLASIFIKSNYLHIQNFICVSAIYESKDELQNFVTYNSTKFLLNRSTKQMNLRRHLATYVSNGTELTFQSAK